MQQIKLKQTAPKCHAKTHAIVEIYLNYCQQQRKTQINNTSIKIDNDGSDL